MITKITIRYEELEKAIGEYFLGKSVEIILHNVNDVITIDIVYRFIHNRITKQKPGISMWYGGKLSHNYYNSLNTGTFVISGDLRSTLVDLFISFVEVITCNKLKLMKCNRFNNFKIQANSCCQCKNYLICISEGIDVIV